MHLQQNKSPETFVLFRISIHFCSLSLQSTIGKPTKPTKFHACMEFRRRPKDVECTGEGLGEFPVLAALGTGLAVMLERFLDSKVVIVDLDIGLGGGIFLGDSIRLMENWYLFPRFGASGLRCRSFDPSTVFDGKETEERQFMNLKSGWKWGGSW